MVHKRAALQATIRTVVGKKVKQLRNQGYLPSSVYGKGMTSISVQMLQKDAEKVFEEAGESALVDLTIEGGETWPILFKNPQYDPREGNLLHVDLHKVNLKEKITAMVPIELVGVSDAVKAGNVLMEITSEVEVEALPTELPEKIIVDISKLVAVDDAILVSDLAIDRKQVEVKTDADQVIVKIAAPKEEIIEEVPVAPVEVEATKQKAPEAEEAEAAAGKSEKKEDKKSEK